MFSRRVLTPARDDTAPATVPPAQRQPPSSGTLRRLVLPGLFVFGLIAVSYLLGAAVLYFDLPSSSYLRRAFGGGVAWYEREQASRLPDAKGSLTVGPVD